MKSNLDVLRRHEHSLSFSKLRSVTAEFCPTLTFTGRLNLLSDQHYVVDKGFQTLSNLISVKSLGVCLIVVCEMILCWCAIIIEICNFKVGDIDTSDVHFMQE